MRELFYDIVSVISFITAIIVDTILGICDLFQKPKAHAAKWGHESLISSIFNKGFLISRHRKLTRRQSYENLLLVGPTGSGKTSRLILKIASELKHCSLVINDPSKELFISHSGYLGKTHDIKVLNFSDSASSSGYNFLSHIKKPSDINKVSDMLVRATIDKNASDPFWSLQAKSLITILIQIVMYQDSEFKNMANVLHLLKVFAAHPETIDNLVIGTNDQKLILDYKALIATPEKTLQNIVASAKSALEIFDSEDIAKVTSYDSISFQQLRERPTVLFLHSPISDMKFNNTLIGIFMDQMYGHILNKLPDKKELDQFVVLEEASSIYVGILPTALANCRKHRVGNVICCQSPNQLATMYKNEAENITSNCLTKIYLPGMTTKDTLSEIEMLGGKTTYKDDKGAEKVKPLIAFDEIRILPKNRSLILCSNHPLIKGRTSPYYKSIKYRLRSKIPPVPCGGSIPQQPLSLIGQTV